MNGWVLHWLEAEGELGSWRAAIEAEFAVAHAATAAVLPPPRLDIIVQRLEGAGIPELGMVGHAYRRACFGLTLDPMNPHFATALAAGALRRQITHEVHHCLRMAATGYGRTLGEALASEGLAGQFTRRVFGNPPEPWERAIPPTELRGRVPDRETLDAPRYDHRAWFFGADDPHPRWLGYTLGYGLAGLWAEASPRDAEALVMVPAAELLDVALPLLHGAD